jgi:paraquat-inducible protein B
MSIRANPTVIGAFVVGAVVLFLVALLVWGGTGLFRTKHEYVLFFDSAVTGLNKGAPVLARGVKVGEVSDIEIRWGTPLVAVYVLLEPQVARGTAKGGPKEAIERLVRDEGLRAQLRLQSFVTGVLYVALEFRPDTPVVLRSPDRRVPELPTIPTDLEVWTAKLEKFAEKIGTLPFDQIGQNVAVILEEAKKIVGSQETQELFRNANAAISDARTLLQDIDKNTVPRLDAGLDAARKLALGVDSRVDPLVSQVEATLKAAQVAVSDLRPVIENMRNLAAKLDAQADPLLTSLRGTLDGAQLTLGSVDRTLEQESPLGFELFQTMRDLRAAAQALRSLADYLERVPDAPIYGVRRPSAGVK